MKTNENKKENEKCLSTAPVFQLLSQPGTQALSLLCLVIERKLTEREIGIEVLTVSILQGNEWTTLYLTLSKSSFNSKLKTPFLILTC